MKDPDANIRRAALANLTEEPLLIKVALQDGDASVRESAVARLTDRSLLAKIAVEDRDSNVRGAAAATLKDWALSDKKGEWGYWNYDWWKVTNQAVQARIVSEDSSAVSAGGGESCDKSNSACEHSSGSEEFESKIRRRAEVG